MSVEKDSAKLAQLFNCLSSSHASALISKILEKDGDINFALPRNDGVMKCYEGMTALHYALTQQNIILFNALLEHGADYALKDKNGETVLTKWKSLHLVDNLFVRSVLSKHLKASSCCNPINQGGVSHFHIACIASNLEAAEYFLKNEVGINDAVSIDSEFSPGYTALHFAAKNNNYSLVKMLVEYGADLNILNGRKMTALHILIETRLELFDNLRLITFQHSLEKVQTKIFENGKMIQIIMEHVNKSDDIIGLSIFHIASILQDFGTVANISKGILDINQSINANSHLWAGYTALHFAAHTSVEMAIFLIGLGANIQAKNLKKITAFNICIEKYKVKEIRKIVESQKKWESIAFSGDTIKLMDFLSVLQNDSSLEDVMSHSNKSNPYTTFIDKDSPLWPGFTLLHLAVLFSKEPKEKYNLQDSYEHDIFFKIIKMCLKNGANLMKENELGQTPLHLAFRLGKINIAHLILQLSHKIIDSIDSENLSHLHILTSYNKPDLLKILESKNCNVNVVYNGSLPIGPVQPGFTALHVALQYREICDVDDSISIIKLLLKLGANRNAVDVHGLTPVHRLLSFPQAVAGCIAPHLLKNIENLVASEYNLSYLHVACFSNDRKAVESLLMKGVDVNMKIKIREKTDNDPLWFLVNYSGCPPLHMSCNYFKPDIPALLIEYGANVFLNIDDERFLQYESSMFHAILENLKRNVKFQSDMEAKFGVTKLHLACEQVSFRKIRNLLDSGAKINAQVDISSPIWKGYTPLHVLIAKTRRAAMFKMRSTSHDIISNTLVLLLEKGADVTIQNEQKESPIGIFFRFYYLNDREHKMLDRLMQRIVDFTVNPVNKEGVSHFHIACYVNNIGVVRKFLENGICIQQSIDFFSYTLPGASPLHFTTKPEIINLLVERGFNVQHEDAHGNTPLHKVAERFPFNYTVFDKLIESGALINAENINGETPLEMLLSRTTASFENIVPFLKYGCFINTRNHITNTAYVSILVSTKYTDHFVRDQVIEWVLNSSEMSNSSMKHTLLHDIVSVSKTTLKVVDYTILIKKLMKHGYDIDAQDYKGKTALICSVIYGNKAGVAALLMCGADINIIDTSRKTVMNYLNSIDYQQRPSNIEIRKLMNNYAQKLEIFNLELNHVNHECFKTMKSTYPSDMLDENLFLEQIAVLSQVEIKSIHLRQFLSKHGILMTYSAATMSTRRILIDEFVELIEKDNRFSSIRDIINLQYRKGINRSKLVFLAANSVKKVLGFNLPHLCALIVFEFLKNSELQNLIEADVNNEMNVSYK